MVNWKKLLTHYLIFTTVIKCIIFFGSTEKLIGKTYLTTNEHIKCKDSQKVALLLSIFFGDVGLDRFYLGYFWIGLFKLFTCGGAGYLWFWDIVHIATGVLQPLGTIYCTNII